MQNGQTTPINKLKVVEIFKSIDGEVNHFNQGRTSTFIRLAGCNLNCHYCDTEYAKNPGSVALTSHIPEDIVKLIKKDISIKNITITGGEPLYQKFELLDLLNLLGDEYNISIETNGSFFIPFDAVPHVSWVIDYKLPSSGMQKRMFVENFYKARSIDWIKFIVGGDKDYREMKTIMDNIKFHNKGARFAVSPIMYKNNRNISFAKARQLLDKILSDDLNVVFSLQIHKLLFVEDLKEGISLLT